MLAPRVVEVTALDGYKLLLTYETSEKRIFDVAPYIKGAWYGKLRDASYFKSARIAGGTVQWAGSQDLAPHELYDNSAPVA